MARQLWLLRHGEAEPHGAREDSQRRLTERGEGQARAVGLAFTALGAHFDAILASPKVRAWDTACLALGIRGERPVRHLALAQGFGADEALQQLAAISTEGRLLVVGHEPDLSRTVTALARSHVDLKKGGIAVVRVHADAGELLALWRPRELALMGAAASPELS